ncbi:MAG: hypothetical protein WCW25_02415 [Patescibacteria group bacterium]
MTKTGDYIKVQATENLKQEEKLKLEQIIQRLRDEGTPQCDASSQEGCALKGVDFFVYLPNKCGFIRAVGRLFAKTEDNEERAVAETELFYQLQEGDKISQQAALGYLLHNKPLIENWVRLFDFMTDPKNSDIVTLARQVMPGECEHFPDSASPPAA